MASQPTNSTHRSGEQCLGTVLGLTAALLVSGAVVTETVFSLPGVGSASVSVFVRTGSAHEGARLNGISHVVEHMAFKGTARRTAIDIAEEIEAVGGELNAATSLVQSFRMFNDMSNAGDYRVNFDVGASTKISKWLTWNVSLSDRYLNNPAPGRKTNDLLYTTGLGITFAK